MMQEVAFDAEVSAQVEAMIRDLGDRAGVQARANLLRALDDGSPDVALAYEVCLRLIERQSHYRTSIRRVPAPPGMLNWLRTLFSTPRQPVRAVSSEPAH